MANSCAQRRIPVSPYGVKVLQTINGTTIGRKRIITFPAKEVSAVRFTVTSAKASPLISEIEIYNIDGFLVEKE